MKLPPIRASSPPPLYDLVFVGNMGYFPNVTAAQFIADKIYPLLKKELPELKILIAGANPSPAVKKLADDYGIYISDYR